MNYEEKLLIVPYEATVYLIRECIHSRKYTTEIFFMYVYVSLISFPF